MPTAPTIIDRTWPIGQTRPERFSATLATGAPAAGATIAISIVDAAGGTIASSSGTTDADGVAVVVVPAISTAIAEETAALVTVVATLVDGSIDTLRWWVRLVYREPEPGLP